MRHPLSLATRRELLAATAQRYAAASRKERIPLLTEFVAATGYDRNYACSLLCHPPLQPLNTRGHNNKNGKIKPLKRRAKTYTEQTQKVLEKIWAVAGGICGKRLVPLLPVMLEALERFEEITLSDTQRQKLLQISPATCDRLLAPARAAHPHGLCTTKPTPHLLLRSQIPIRTFADWNEERPGFPEIDLVAHCADSAKGSYAYTLTAVDVFSGWTLCAALPNKSCLAVSAALDTLRQKLPFPLLGIDTDNGGEFINHNLVRYCEQNSITMTRCRPYKKNDQCHVEQKNGNIVRAMAGYGRYEGPEALKGLAQLYRRLGDYQNFFQPSMKLLTKQRDGAKVKKAYSAAQTPTQRLLASDAVASEVKEALRARQAQINPAALHREMLSLRQELRRLAVDYLPEMEVLASLCEVAPDSSAESSAESKAETASPDPARPEPGDFAARVIVSSVSPAPEQSYCNLTAVGYDS